MAQEHPLEGLKAARLKAGLTRQALAEAIGVTPTSYDRFENGTRRIYFDRVIVLAKTLGVSIDSLLHAPEDGAAAAARELAGWDVEPV